MIHNLNNTDVESIPSYDVIIIGTGPSGVVLANELADEPSLSICILESGNETTTDYGDGLKEVTWDDMRIKKTSRERVLGGASTTWYALSAPFDEFELTGRDYLETPGWPLTKEEMKPFYQRASRDYGFPDYTYFAEEESNPWKELRTSGDIKPVWGAIEEKMFLAPVNPQRFAQERMALFSRDNVDLYLDASAKRLLWEEAGGEAELTGVLTVTSGNREVVFRGDTIVVCAGGLENARLLLNSKGADGVGLGNRHEQVGRYLMNHPKCYECRFQLQKPVYYLPYYFGAMWKGFSGYAGFRLKESEQKRQQLVNAYVRFEPLFPWSDNEGVDSLLYLVKRAKFFFEFWKKLNVKKLVELRSYAETGDETRIEEERPPWYKLAWNIVSNLNLVLQYSWYRLLKRPIIDQIRLCSFMEMEPHKDNRVFLSDKKDVHGYPLAHVSYRTTERDRNSLITLTKVLATELEAQRVGTFDLGRIEEEGFFESMSKDRGVDASHHIGSTRMGAAPESSVVDINQKVHGCKNLYMNGSSVFPTSGVANPTYTIVAMTIRLGRHIKSQLTGKTKEES